MELIIHLIDDNRLIVLPDEMLSPSQAARIADVIGQWNRGEIDTLLLPCESEIIDMRTPQKEMIEAMVNQVIDMRTQKTFNAVIAGLWDTVVHPDNFLSEEEFRAKYGDAPIVSPANVTKG